MSVFLFNNVFIDMSIQKKLIEDILSSYDIINENKKFIQESSLVKLSSTGYSNLKYDMDGTQNDEVNKPLLDDLNAAAKAASYLSTLTPLSQANLFPDLIQV